MRFGWTARFTSHTTSQGPYLFLGELVRTTGVSAMIASHLPLSMMFTLVSVSSGLHPLMDPNNFSIQVMTRAKLAPPPSQQKQRSTCRSTQRFAVQPS